MCLRRFGIFFTLAVLFIVLKIEATASHKHSLLHVLSQLKPPYIAVLYPKGDNINENDNIKIDEADVTDDITPDIDSLAPPYDQKAYLLYHALRTTEEREQIDPEAAVHFENTKDILRQALRIRCKKLSSCYEECPKRVYTKCTIECRETYDDFDVCQKKKKKNICNKPKCGKTLPPTWLQRVLDIGGYINKLVKNE